MENPFLKKPATLLAFFALVIGSVAVFFLMHRGAEDNTAKPDSASVSSDNDTADSLTFDEVNDVAVKKDRDESTLEYRSTESGATLKVSLNQAALFDADGKEEIVRLNPAATAGTLRQRLSELEAPKGVMPVVYQDDEEGGSLQPSFVTSEILAKLPQEQAELLASKHGLIIKDRPSYAPEYVIFSAAQPLEALEKIEGIRGENFVEMADVLLASNATKRELPDDPVYREPVAPKRQRSGCGRL